MKVIPQSEYRCSNCDGVGRISMDGKLRECPLCQGTGEPTHRLTLQKIWMDKTARLRRNLGRREHEAHTKRLRAAGVRGAVAKPELPFSLKRFREWLQEQASSVNNTERTNFVTLPLLWTCPFCNEPFDMTQLSVDHDTPLSRGGGTVLDNLLCVDKQCNTDKGDLGSAEYKLLYQLVAAWRPKDRTAFWRRWRSLATYLQRSRKGEEAKPRRSTAERHADDWMRVIERSRRG